MTRLFAFVDILMDSPSKTEVVTAITKLPNIEEFYEATGKLYRRRVAWCAHTALERAATPLQLQIRECASTEDTYEPRDRTESRLKLLEQRSDPTTL